MGQEMTNLSGLEKVYMKSDMFYYLTSNRVAGGPLTTSPHNTLHRSVGPADPHRAFPKDV